MIGLYLVGPISNAFGFGASAAIGYATMIICFSMCLVVSYALLWLLKPYDIDDYKEIGASAEEAKEVETYSYKDLFKQKNFIAFLIFAAVALGFASITDNVFSHYWTNTFNAIENKNDDFQFFQNNMLSVAAGTRVFVETLIALAFTALLRTKNLKKIIAIPGISLFLWALGLGILVYVAKPNMENASGIMGGLISIDMLRGLVWGPYIAVYVPILENILGIKLKTKGLFSVVVLYQMFNLTGQVVYPYIIKGFDGSVGSGHAYLFFIIAGIALLNLLNLFFFKINMNKTGTSVKADRPTKKAAA